MGDRLQIEDMVQARFGKAGMPGQRAHVVVGTQVMEQSLDLDFDVLISDLAPVDLLLQRAGRLWRHARDARPEAKACFHVIAPESVADPGVEWLKDFRGTAAVYDDPALLWRSCRALLAKPVLQLPGDVRGLVEAAYAQEAELPQGLERRSMAAVGRGAAARGMAWQNLLSWQDGYAESGGPWMSEALTPTRLADPSFIYRLAVWENGRLRPLCEGEKAWAMSEITLPLRRVKGLPEETGERAAALTTCKAGWSRWEQDVPVLILEPDEGGFVGNVIGADGKPQHVAYNHGAGLLWR
jgi:CRISPR-associated endonuclease/helicase Cas3